MTNQPNNQPNNPPAATAMRALNPVEKGAHDIGIELADEAFLYDAGVKGMTAEKLQERWSVAYTLGRNGVEHAMGAERPYAANRIDELRASSTDKPSH